MEPIYMTITASQPKRTRSGQARDEGREYLTTWYVGQIPEDAVSISYRAVGKLADRQI